MTEGNERTYARAVVEALARIEGHAVVLSPRDWTLLSAWRGKGVPLGTVLEALRAASRRLHTRPRSALAYAAPAVEEAWQALREARASGFTTESGIVDSRPTARDRWRSALERTASGSSLRELLAGLVARLDGGEDPSGLDRELDRWLPEAAPENLRERAREEVHARFLEVRERIRHEARLEATERAFVDTLRARLDLPRLTLCDKDRSR